MNILYKSEYKKLLERVPSPILIGYGGSYAYGTNTETSDIDIRGIYMNPLSELIGIKTDSEQIVDDETDTTIYSFRKIIKLLVNCNPNTIELLGLRTEDYLYMTEAGQLLLDNKNLFLSKMAAHTFAGYAQSQLNRLINKGGRKKEKLIENELRSLDKVATDIVARYKTSDDRQSITNLTFRDSDNIVMADIEMHDIPLQTLKAVLSDINNVHRDYEKSSRNEKAIKHEKLNKHMMHLIRLYMMGIDILEKQEIITYRVGKDHELLMSIRNCDYLEDDMATPTAGFEALLSDYQKRFEEAKLKSTLPDEPDYKAVDELVIRINKMYM